MSWMIDIWKDREDCGGKGTKEFEGGPASITKPPTRAGGFQPVTCGACEGTGKITKSIPVDELKDLITFDGS